MSHCHCHKIEGHLLCSVLMLSFRAFIYLLCLLFCSIKLPGTFSFLVQFHGASTLPILVKFLIVKKNVKIAGYK